DRRAQRAAAVRPLRPGDGDGRGPRDRVGVARGDRRRRGRASFLPRRPDRDPRGERGGGSLMLELRAVRSGYGRIEILHGVDLVAQPGQTVGLFGRNGAGKTTLVETVMGLHRVADGDIRWEGESIRGLRTERIVRAGISLVPQSRGLFMG